MGQFTRRLFLGASSAAIIAASASAALFSGAAISSSSNTIGTMTLKTKSGGNLSAGQMFEFGLPIKPGDLSSSQKIQLYDASNNLLPCQEDNRVVDANGDSRFVKLTTILQSAPGTSSTTVTIKTTTGSPDTSNPITVSNLLSQTIGGDTYENKITLTMPNGDVWVAKATDGLSASSTWTYGSPYFKGYWRQGPYCTEFVCLVPFMKSGVAHPYLYVEFHIAAFKANSAAWDNSSNPITGVKTFWFIHNGFNGTSSGWSGTPQDYAYDLLNQVGATTLSTALSLTGGAQTGNLTVSALYSDMSGGNPHPITATRASGSWALSTSAPNSSDPGKALIELSGSGTGIAYINGYSSTTDILVWAPQSTPFSSLTVTSWKTMGVYHYYRSRVSNTNPVIAGNWWGTNFDAVYPILPTSYLFASQMVPNFAMSPSQVRPPTLGTSSTGPNGDGCHPCGMNMGHSTIKNVNINEAATGGADHIGVFTEQQAIASIYWDDATYHATARQSIIYNAELGHRKPQCFMNEIFGGFNGIDECGINCPSGIVPILDYNQGNQWYTIATNHSGQANYFPYLVTGDLYHLQGLHCLAGTWCWGTGYIWYEAEFLQSKTAVTVNTSTGLVTANPTYGAGSSLPTEAGEAFTFQSFINGWPRIGGVAVNNTAFYWGPINSTQGYAYTTRANALAGGTTGRIAAYSSAGTQVYLVNGYNSYALAPKSDGAQTREVAWGERSAGQLAALMPSTLISANVVAPYTSRATATRRLAMHMDHCNTAYTTNSNYVAGGPRYLDNHNGTNCGQWQINYLRQSLMNLYCTGVQAAVSDLGSFLKWLCADVNQWHVNTTDSFPPSYCSSYYFIVAASADNLGTPSYYTYADIYKCAIGFPWGRGTAYAKYNNPSNQLGSISDVSDPANVTITLTNPYWDMSNKTPYEGKAWIKVGNGVGQIKTLVSSTVCIADSTVSSWYGTTTGNAAFSTGSGQTVVLPLPSPGNAASVVPSADLAYFGGRFGTSSGDYGSLDRSSLEITYQLGIDTGNYAGAVAEMEGRGLPPLASWTLAQADTYVRELWKHI